MDHDFGSLQDIYFKIRDQKRLSFEDGVRLYQSTDLLALGQLAQIVRERLHGKRVFYSANLHLNYTNICTSGCAFCAFSKKAGEKEAYTLSLEEIQIKIREAIEKWHINEVHMVGGLNPELDLDYFLEMFESIRRIDPDLYIKSLTAPEVDALAGRSGLSWKETLWRLKEAGLDGLPGGGAEIFNPEIRRKICPKKISGEDWLEVHRLAHRIGLNSNATMLYGHLEKEEERVAHVLKLRDLQDETNGFLSFIPLPYRQENNVMPALSEASGFLDLKVLCISRLLLDNIPHLKVHWSATDLKFAQTAFSFGADDLGGTNFKERILHEAGSQAPRDIGTQALEKIIQEAGYKPCFVNSSYQENLKNTIK